jgi:hypothetical protein
MLKSPVKEHLEENAWSKRDAERDQIGMFHDENNAACSLNQRLPSLRPIGPFFRR